MLWTETRSLKTGSSTIALRAEMAASLEFCGITGTEEEEGEDEVEGSTALETLLMHRTISSTSVNGKSCSVSKCRVSPAYLIPWNKILKMFPNKWHKICFCFLCDRILKDLLKSKESTSWYW